MRKRTEDGFPILRRGTKIGELFRILVYNFGRGVDSWSISQEIKTTCLHSHADDLRGILPRELVLFCEERSDRSRFYGITTRNARGVGDFFFEDDFARLRKAAERAVETMDRKESRS